MTCCEPDCTQPAMTTSRARYKRCREHHGKRASEAYWRGQGIDPDARTLDAGGYAHVRDPETGKRVPEHRYVMEQKLGRPLAKGESVHHIDGDRANNDPNNLELWVTSPRYGQRAADVRCPHCGEAWLSDS